jgi:hypothetical protein
MGSRAYVKVLSLPRGPDVLLYTHWQCEELPEIVRRALAHRQRWDDAPYLTRAIFEEMVVVEAPKFTGLGIEARARGRGNGTGEPTVVVDVQTKRVWIEDDIGMRTSKVFSFVDYIAMGELTMFGLRDGGTGK